LGGFLGTATSFPVVVLTFALVVVIGYWLLVLFGVSDLEDSGFGFGLGGVPAGVSLTLVVALGWFGALVVTVAVEGLSGPARIVTGVVGLVVALVLALLVTRLVVVPLRGVFAVRAPSRDDFVGLLCVVRTGRVDQDFGQAEVTTPDGSSAVIQVRQAGDGPLTNGASAVIYQYDAEGEFFWVSPYDSTRD
jgi:hypothetical protein